MKTHIWKMIIPAVFAALLMAGCGISAHIQKDPGVNLADYKTYKWLNPVPENDGKKKPKKYTDFQDNYLRKIIAEQLEKKGYKEVKGDADVSIDYDVMVENESRNNSQSVYSNPFIRYRYNPYTRRINSYYFPSQYLGQESFTVPYKSGTITVNLVDNKTNTVAWQGWAETEVDRRNLSTAEMNDIVGAIFKKFKL